MRWGNLCYNRADHVCKNQTVIRPFGPVRSSAPPKIVQHSSREPAVWIQNGHQEKKSHVNAFLHPMVEEGDVMRDTAWKELLHLPGLLGGF
jgi:hypothetical protein